MRALGPGLSVLSILCGVFGILAPGIAWAAQFLSFLSFASDDANVEAAGTFALFGSFALAATIVASAPTGIALGAIALPVCRSQEQTMFLGGIGIALNLVAPVTWLLTWAGLVAWLLWAMEGFHF